MARPEAVAKELYYPTPAHLMVEIGELFAMSGERVTYRVIDTCCGEGAALKALASKFRTSGFRSQSSVDLYGVEINKRRAQKALEVLDFVLPAPLERVILGVEEYEMLFINPPYDYNGEGGRLELDFLKKSYACLRETGQMVAILPEHVLEREDVNTWLVEHFQDFEAYRFPPGEYEVFKQVAVLARKGQPRADYSGTVVLPSIAIQEWSALREGGYRTARSLPYRYDTKKPPFSEVNWVPEAPGPGEGVFGTRKWAFLAEGLDRPFANPVLFPRKGHRAMMLAAGALNGTEVDGFLVRGRALRVKETSDTPDGDTLIQERIVTEFCTLDLSTKVLDRWTTDEKERTAEWLRKYAKPIGEALSQTCEPQFHDHQVEQYEPFFEKFHPPGVLPGRDKPEWPFAQKRVIAAIHDYWKRGEKCLLLSGEMGLGKTAMGTAAVCMAAASATAKKTVIVCPTHIVDKWTREPQKITGEKCTMVAKKASDVHRFFEDPSMLFLVVSKERAKLGTKFVTGSYAKPRRRLEDGKLDSVRNAVCPDCGRHPYTTSSWGSKWEEKTKKRQTCIHCGAPQWRYTALTAKGTKRWPLAKVISRYARRYHLILDEAHQYSKAETDQSKAVQRLISNATKVVAMTGTVYNGRASSLFHLLYKLSHRFREMYKFDEASRFSEHFGLFERVITENESYSRYGVRRGQAKERVKEVPGMSPAMIPLLLPMAVFIKLSDLGEDLPPYEEELRILEGDAEMTKAAQQMQQRASDQLRKYPQASGSYLMACLGYPDCPERGDEIVAQIRDKETGEVEGQEILAKAPVLDVVSIKDHEVLKEALKAQKDGRRVLVYCTQTGKRDVRKRLQALLSENGLTAVILDSSVPPEKRMAWVRKQEKAGFDVMITNGRLVETGVDLMWATTIIQYGIEYSINSLRQSTRRSWRLGQLHPVRVIYLAYKSTMQEVAVRLIAKKMEAAELVDGDELGGLAQTGGGSFQVELLREVA